MLIKLNQKDFVHLVMGSSVGYAHIKELEGRSLGTFSGSYDRWDWNKTNLSQLTETELWDLYQYLNA